MAYSTDLQDFNLFLLRVFEGIAFTELDYQHIRSWLADLKKINSQPGVLIVRYLRLNLF
ncbi:hypothetical protein LWM68_32395 [Niabella sp. W65]|nr:hypothetical protein [Niabella sp. W65]MCH7367050.1 hypothetical protein [Niabella sp. W65]